MASFRGTKGSTSEHQLRHREQQKELRCPPVMDKDIPENADTLKPIEGLDAVEINTLLMESVTTPFPEQGIFKNLEILDLPELYPLCALSYEVQMDFLKFRHKQPDFDKILARSRETKHDITPWPELKLHPDQHLQSLKPHQVDDAASIVERAFDGWKHTFLSNETGMGKTRAYLAAIVLHQRELEKQAKAGVPGVKFLPSLILTSSSTLDQTAKEARAEFLHLNVFVFHGTPNKGVKVISVEELVGLLNRTISNSDKPENENIVVLSTYSTWSSRTKGTAAKNAHFELLVADDAHTINTIRGTHHRMLRTLQWRKLVWVPGLYQEQYDPYTNKTQFSEGITVGIFTEHYLSTNLSFIKLKDIYEESGRKSRLWMVHPNIFKAAGDDLGWGKKAVDLLVQPIFSVMQIRRTMYTKHTLPDGIKAYSAIDQFSSTVVVEECNFDCWQPYAATVELMGKEHSKVLFGQNSESDFFAAYGEVILNLSEHRKGVLTSFDWRNHEVLNPNNPILFGTVDEVKKISKLLKSPTVTQRENNDETAALPAVCGVERVDLLLENDYTCGLSLLFHLIEKTELIGPPVERATYTTWICGYSPVMTRALDLAWKYCKEGKERLLVYVDDAWIQCIVVGLFVMAGFKVGTVRASDTRRSKIIDKWNERSSSLEILVIDVDSMLDGVNIHTNCTKGLLLNWLIDPKRMLHVIGSLVRIGQQNPVMFHILKTKNTYYDNLERICCTKWAIQLSTEINLPEWMTGEVREICVFEWIKTSWHQSFNRYAWVVEHDVRGHDIEYHSSDMIRLGHVFSLAAKLIIGHPEDWEFWVDSMPVLVQACHRMMESFDTPGEIEGYLSRTPEELRDGFIGLFELAIGLADSDMKDEGIAERCKKIRGGVDARAKP
ncbi:hypothetical protein NW762_003962 [Fusarium torreyae]|uniref:Helicase ATP-binding domain-containing protein n=1 Tax=Fusarium torreyae TaxID=1237075 RepID=A0A9W8S5U4_9HYPO|nr:hypothetical protein NW762_003962 [Fusarium torreyae]